MPIYWLNGNKVADDYGDFYDGSWDEEATLKTEAGNTHPTTFIPEYGVEPEAAPGGPEWRIVLNNR